MHDQVPGNTQSALHPVGADLTVLAQQGKFTPLAQHHDIVEQILMILAKGPSLKRYIPVLIGESSLERFNVMAEVIRRMAVGDAPALLHSHHVLALDLKALFAEISSQIMFEQRLREVLWQTNQTSAILLVDPLHALVGGDLAHFPFDGRYVLKSFLGRRQIQMLGATNIGGYRHIEGSGLPSRFQAILMRDTNN